jgi:hypothetical protein
VRDQTSIQWRQRSHDQNARKTSSLFTPLYSKHPRPPQLVQRDIPSLARPASMALTSPVSYSLGSGSALGSSHETSISSGAEPSASTPDRMPESRSSSCEPTCAGTGRAARSSSPSDP